MNCRESLKFRSFEDDLIDDKTWQQKDILLEQLNLPILSQPIELHLQELEAQLEKRLSQVNQRIAKQENESFNSKGTRWSLKYPTQNETHSDSFLIRCRRLTFIKSCALFINKPISLVLSRICGENMPNKRLMKRLFQPV